MQLIIQYLGKGTYTISPETNSKHESKMLQLDITKTVNQLGWKPVLTIQKAVEFTVNEYCNANVNNRLEHINSYMQLRSL